MLYIFEKYFLLFLIYSILGFIMEVVCKIITEKKIINRGFLIGPYCPIYGTGALLLTFLLEPFKFNVFLVFFLAILICGTLEYMTSYIMEKLFKARWWDYSSYKFNINGRVCLRTIIPFGIFGTLIIYVTNPFILGLISSISFSLINIISLVLLASFVIDNIVSFNVILRFKQIATNVKVDSTEEISNKVKQVIYEEEHKLQQRLIKAFPNFKPSMELIKKKKEEILNSASKLKESIDERIDEVGDNISEKFEKINNTIEENIVNVKRKVGKKSYDRNNKKI